MTTARMMPNTIQTHALIKRIGRVWCAARRPNGFPPQASFRVGPSDEDRDAVSVRIDGLDRPAPSHHLRRGRVAARRAQALSNRLQVIDLEADFHTAPGVDDPIDRTDSL